MSRIDSNQTEKFSAYSNSRPDLFFFHLKRGIGGIVDSSKAPEEDRDQDLVGYIAEHKKLGGGGWGKSPAGSWDGEIGWGYMVVDALRTGCTIETVTIFGLQVSYEMERATVFRMIVNFKLKQSTLTEGDEKLPFEVAFSRLIAAVVH